MLQWACGGLRGRRSPGVRALALVRARLEGARFLGQSTEDVGVASALPCQRHSVVIGFVDTATYVHVHCGLAFARGHEFVCARFRIGVHGWPRTYGLGGTRK